MVKSRFPVVWRGYEPKAVDAALQDLRAQLEHAEATTTAARTYAASLLDELQRLHDLEDELSAALELARQTGRRMLADVAGQAEALIADADVQAGARLAVAELEARDQLQQAESASANQLAQASRRAAALEADAEQRANTVVAHAERQSALQLASAEHRARAQLEDADERSREQLREAEERSVALLAATELTVSRQVADAQALLDRRAADLERYRQAVLAEIAMMAQAEGRLGPRLSRAAARLIEVVDAPDGLGAFSRNTDALVRVARLMQRANEAAALERPELSEQPGEVVFRFRTDAVDLRGVTTRAGGTAGPARHEEPPLPMVSVAEPDEDPSLEPPVVAPRLQA